MKPERDLGLRPVLEEVATLLRAAPTLEAEVAAAVQEVVLLEAPPDFDISHSEPRWPRAIFVSVPDDRSPASALRALENIVHEAMHLRLTTVELRQPLVADTTSRMASPWREEPRTFQGVLHGAYVFGCIRSFFEAPGLQRRLTPAGLVHVERRCREIADDLLTIDADRLAAGLAPLGHTLLGELTAWATQSRGLSAPGRNLR